jgi:HEAT repeat protein
MVLTPSLIVPLGSEVPAFALSVRRAALGVLSYFGHPSTLELFLGALKDPAAEVREAAVQGLALVDAAGALEELLAAAKHAEPRMRAAAMRALVHSGRDPRVDANLARALGDPDPWVRYYACQSLGKRRCEIVCSGVIELLRDPAGQVRVAAIEALSRFESAEALAALRSAAGSPDGELMRAALIGLGLTARPEVLPVLRTAIRASDPTTRLLAVSALAPLATIAPHEVMPILAAATNDAHEEVRSAALGLLATMPGPEPAQALIAVVAARPEDRRARTALSTAVPGRIEAIAGALESAQDDVALELASALARLRAEHALIRALECNRPAVRKAAATALATLPGASARAAIARAATTDSDPEVRTVCTLLTSR